ncbi:MAG: deoxyribodipyrimidine photo-lyase [Candidatus Eremiobacteraeota bacterium]|nr:deoxyribodipyrimidine photo-lyase [Candidatus Eremiobacteraeota bacterium]
MRTVLFRFTRDLRVEDHAGLAEAARHGTILPVLVIDELLRARIMRSPRRAAFFVRAVRSLDAALREQGSALVVRRGPLRETLLALADEVKPTAVVWSASYDAAAMRQDEELRALLEDRGIEAPLVHDAPAIPPEETAAAKLGPGEGYRALGPYLEAWRSIEVVSHEAPLFRRFAKPQIDAESLPTEREFDAANATDDSGTDDPRRRLTSFLRQDVLQYAVAVNVPADDRTSHLAADLSFGTIAARTVVRETKRRSDDPFLLAEERASLRRFLRSLAQRDFFLQLAWFLPQAQAEPLQFKMREFPFQSDHERLNDWKEGITGFTLVDAGIRQLHATGWMHPHARAIAASFLCFDLQVDWRVGLAEWDRYLIEDEPALAIGNWQWIAGVGADLAAYPRIYNPVKGARRFDPDGIYARAWIAELAHGVTPFDVQRQPALPLFGRDGYPAPIVDHDAAARRYLKRYSEFVAAARPGGAPRSNR